MKLLNKFDRNALFIILEGIAFTMIFNLYNPFIQMFGKRLGAEDIHIALLNAAPPLVAIFVLIPCGILIERINSKKKTTIFLIFMNSLFYAAIAFVPFIPDRAKVVIYVLFIGLMNMPGSLYITTWQSFFADTFSGSQANRVYSLRGKYGAFFGLFTALLTGWILTSIPKTEEGRLVVYQFFYVACFAISLLQLYFLSRVRPETAGPDADDNGRHAVSFKLADFKDMFANKGFNVFCLCAFAFHFTWQMGWPLFFIYNVDYAGLNEFQLGLISVAAGLTSFLSFSIWNRLMEKYGSRLIILIGAAGLAMNPFFFTAQAGFYRIIAVNVIVGISAAAFNLALFCGLLETLPESKKTVYISFFNTLTNITGFIAPLVGVWIYEHATIYLAMLIVGILRMTATTLYAARWWQGRKIRKLEVSNKSLEA